MAAKVLWQQMIPIKVVTSYHFVKTLASKQTAQLKKHRGYNLVLTFVLLAVKFQF